MLSPVRITAAASQLREDVGLDVLEPIPDIDAVIANAGYRYRADHFGDEFSGFCMKLGPADYLVGFNSDHYWNERFRRFTVSHEMGHLALHREMLESGTMHRSRPEYQSMQPKEREADAFAAAFLAPRPSVRTQISGRDFSRDTLEHLAQFFGISYYAAALRFIEVTDLACGLFVCNGTGNIDYEKRSEALKAVLRHDFVSKRPLSTRTATYDFVLGTSDDRECIVPIYEWYPDCTADVDVTEVVVPLGYNNKYLTLVTPNSTEFE